MIARFGNDTKPQQAQSTLMSMQQGKTESAHDYALRFETVLEKIPHYDESWIQNLFIWGLQPHLATQVNIQNPSTLNRAIRLAKKADVAARMSRRPGPSGSSGVPQKKNPVGPKPTKNYAGHPGDIGCSGKTQKSNKNFYYHRGQSSGNPRGGFQSQGNRTAPPPSRVGPMNPGPRRGGGPGPCRGGLGNQQRPCTAGVRAIDVDEVMERASRARVQVSSPRGKRTLVPSVSSRETRLPPLWQPRDPVGELGPG